MTRFFTTVLKVPDDWRPGAEITENPYFSAGSWSHALDERDVAMALAAHAQVPRVTEIEDAYKLADALYRAGYKDCAHERDYDPRKGEQWQAVVDALIQHASCNRDSA